MFELWRGATKSLERERESSNSIERKRPGARSIRHLNWPPLTLPTPFHASFPQSHAQFLSFFLFLFPFPSLGFAPLGDPAFARLPMFPVIFRLDDPPFYSWCPRSLSFQQCRVVWHLTLARRGVLVQTCCVTSYACGTFCSKYGKSFYNVL